jgi:hypothetical protein
LLWAVDPEYQSNIDAILKEFEVKKVEKQKFRFCGREINQDDDFNIGAFCKDTAERVKPIAFKTKGRKDDDSVTEGERNQLRSVVGSLAWVARQSRPDLSYMVSRLQSHMDKATVDDLRDCNKLVAQAHNGSDLHLRYRAGAVDMDNCVMVVINDAGWAGEEQVLTTADEQKIREPFRSQEGRIIGFAPDDCLHQRDCPMYIVMYRSNLIGRICRSTMQAETYALSDGIEEATRLRAAITNFHHDLQIKTWVDTSAKHMKQLWISDCRSLVDHLHAAKFTKVTDKRLSVDLAAIRQYLWREPDQELHLIKDRLTKDDAHQIMWIDTSRMLADCLTKFMKESCLTMHMQDGMLKFDATEESKQRKERAKMSRAKDKEDECEQ